jgi:tetratricopeptide (TPR) repeat protein
METLLGYFQRATSQQKEMLVIQSGSDVGHDQIVKVMDLAKRADIKKIGFAMVTRQSEITESLSDAPETDEGKILLDGAEKLFKDKKYEEAIKAYQEVRDKYPDWNYAKHALMMIGLCYDWMGQKEKAIQTLEKSIQEYPHIRDFSPATFYYLGRMYADTGQKEKALEALKECVQISEKSKLKPDRFPLKNARESIRKLEEAEEEQMPE